MAKLRSPINQTQKNGLRGQVDFCYWKGIPYARSWPRKSNLNPTPKQQYYRDLMSYTNARISAQPPLQREAWRAFATATGRGWTDYLKRATFELDKTDDNQEMPYFTAMSATFTYSEPTVKIRCEWDPNQQPDILPFQIFYRPAQPNEVSLTWKLSGYAAKTGRKITQFYEVDLHGFNAAKPDSFDASTGQAIFTLPLSDASGVFVAGQKLDQKNTDYVQTPAYMLEPIIVFTIDTQKHASNAFPDKSRFTLANSGQYRIRLLEGEWNAYATTTPDQLWCKYYQLGHNAVNPPAHAMCIAQEPGDIKVLPGCTKTGFATRDGNNYFYDKDYRITLQSGPVHVWYMDDYAGDNRGLGSWKLQVQEPWTQQIMPLI